MHDLETRTDGAVSYVGAREDAWHRLGKTYYDRDGLTVDEVLTDLDAGTIVSAPVQASVLHDNGVTTVMDPTKKMVVRIRANEIVPLGTVGVNYKIFTEAESFGFLDNLVDSGEALISAAGLLDGGRRAFCCMRLPEGILVGGVDAVDLYIFVYLAHDGSMSVTGAVTPIRTVCRNTVDLALEGASRTWRVRHTSRATLKVAEARRALDLTYAYTNEWAAKAETLLGRRCTDARFAQIVEKLFAPQGDEPAKSAVTAYEGRREILMGLWNADTQDGIKGTAWGAYNTLVEYADWCRPVRGADDSVAAKFTRALTGESNTTELKADFLKTVWTATAK